MRTHLLLHILSVSLVSAMEPSVDSIDYATPSKYLTIKDSLGTRNQITALSAELKDESEIITIQNVLQWMDRNLKHDADRAYSWRNFDDVFMERAFGGCADEGIACGVLLKAAGIPTVWVKTMDVPWIWDFKKGRSFQSWSGHVFLEVYAEGRWMLLNPGAKTIYRDYSPDTRILPGNRFAYHKGNDPKSMIMSLQWEDWKEQTRTYFRGLDESLLPVDPAGVTFLSRSQAFVAGNFPYYQKLTEIATRNGFAVRKSFNSEYDKYLPQAIGHLLLIETHKGQPIVPREVLERYFPQAFEGLRNPDGKVNVAGTTIVYFDFANQSARLSINADNEAE
ncbi:MAG: transglutaminase domain-containing protein [Verrucomicrobiota bacterium]